ncbi:MAG: hypothetical protein ABFQ64_02175 [Campylobacterota bacterium]
MKKILLSIASLAVITTSAMAEDKFFIGLDLVHHDVTFSLSDTYSGMSGSGEDSHVAPSFKIGMVADEYRLYGRYDIAYDEYGISYDSLDLNLEGLHSLSMNTNLYYGLHAGMGWFDIAGIVTDEGPQYGLQAGVIQDINQNLSLEAGIRYTIATAGFYFADGIDSLTLDADSVLALSVGVNFKF